MSLRLLFVAWWSALVVGLACSTQSPEGDRCEFPERRDCDCGGEVGSQQCHVDLDSWGGCSKQCQCEHGTKAVFCRGGEWEPCPCDPPPQSDTGTDDSSEPCDGFGEMECDGECVPWFDENNCGECGVVCPQGSGCRLGECVYGCYVGWQDCPEGMKCTAYVMTPGYCCVDANKCVPIIGDRQLGEPCARYEENDDCAPGLFCKTTTTTGDIGPGICLNMCDESDPGSCADGGVPEASCSGFSDGILPLCYDSCDPLMQEGCQPMRGCYPLGHHGFACMDPGEGVDDEPCDAVADCAVGLACLDGGDQLGCGADRCCTPLCDCGDPDDPVCTAPGEQCVCLFEPDEAPQSYEQVGSCREP